MSYKNYYKCSFSLFQIFDGNIMHKYLKYKLIQHNKDVVKGNTVFLDRAEKKKSVLLILREKITAYKISAAVCISF